MKCEGYGNLVFPKVRNDRIYLENYHNGMSC